MTGHQDNGFDRLVVKDLHTGKTFYGEPSSDEERAHRRDALVRIISKLQRGEELSPEERETAALLLQRDLLIESYGQEAGVSLDQQHGAAAGEFARRTLIAVRTAKLTKRAENPEAERRAAAVGRSLRDRRTQEDTIFAFVAYHLACGHTAKSAISETAADLGKPESTVRSQYYRRKRSRAKRGG